MKGPKDSRKCKTWGKSKGPTVKCTDLDKKGLFLTVKLISLSENWSLKIAKVSDKVVWLLCAL